jgi:hypothetical protein
MQWLSGRYGQTFNRRHATTAMSSRPLLEHPIARDPHLLESCRYAILNPIRAGLCAAPDEWS